MILGNTQIRKLEEDVLAVYNSSDLPIELKRLIADVVLNLIIKKADEAIVAENNQPDNTIYGEEQEDGSIKISEEQVDEQSIFEDKLGELPK